MEKRTELIVKVPIQKRPLFLLRDYGKLKANTVYVRRGSSTDEAKPDEISKMGSDKFESESKADIECGFFNRSNGKTLGAEINIETKYLVVLDDIPDYYEPGPGGFLQATSLTNKNYYRDLIKYIQFNSSFFPIYIAITNKGNKEAVNIRIELEILTKEVEILVDGDEIEKASTDLISSIRPIHSPIHHSSYQVDRQDDKWIIHTGLDRLHAKRTLDLDGTVYIQVKEPQTINAKVTVFFDGQSFPYEQELKIHATCNRVELNWDSIHEKLFNKAPRCFKWVAS